MLKHKFFAVLLFAGLAALVSAQGWDGRGWTRGGVQAPAPETVTVSGSLVISHGSPALKSGDVTYLVSGINRLAAFVDGLKEGAYVTIEGFAITNQAEANLKFLRAAKLTLNGKDYDLTPPPAGPRMRPQASPGMRRYHHLNEPGGNWRQDAPRRNWR